MFVRCHSVSKYQPVLGRAPANMRLAGRLARRIIQLDRQPGRVDYKNLMQTQGGNGTFLVRDFEGVAALTHLRPIRREKREMIDAPGSRHTIGRAFTEISN